jgi:uncharacterized protein
VLAEEEGPSGSRAYIYLSADSGRPANANPPELPSSLTWETAGITETFDFAGDIELQLDATITAFDIGWIAVLFDVPPAGEPFPITAGWLSASLSRVIEEKSEPGTTVLDHRRPITVPVGQGVLYRIPMVANARRIVRGHRLRLILVSEDETTEISPCSALATRWSANLASIPFTARRVCCFQYCDFSGLVLGKSGWLPISRREIGNCLIGGG